MKKSPRNTDAQIVLANALAGLQDLPAAISELESAIQGDPTKMEAYLNLATFQMINREPRKAEAVLREALAKDPGLVDARLVLMNLFWAEGDLARAEAMAKEALTIQPSTRPPTGRWPCFTCSPEGRKTRKPRSAPSRNDEVRLREIQPRRLLPRHEPERGGRPPADRAHLGQGRKSPASLLLSRWRYANGQKEQAQKRLDALLTQEPRNTRVLLLKAELLGADGKVDQALVQAEAAAVADPEAPDGPIHHRPPVPAEEGLRAGAEGVQRGAENRPVGHQRVAAGGQAPASRRARRTSR